MDLPSGPVPPDDTPPGNGHAPDAVPADHPRPEDARGGSGPGDGDVDGTCGGDDVEDDRHDEVPDDDGATGDEAPGRDPLRFSRWMRSSTSGGILTGIALGLQHALEERRERPAFVMEAPGEPEDPDAPIVLHFDPDDPAKTVAVIRAPARGGRSDGSPPPAGGV